MALIKTIDEFQDVASVEYNLDVKVFKPYVEKAQERYLRSVLGDTTLDALEEAYNGADPLSEADARLLKYVQMAVGPLAVYLMAPNISVRVGNTGIQETESDDFRPADDRAIYFMRISYLNDGMIALDNLYKFLERNKATYTDWAESLAYAGYKKYFISTATQFDQYVNIAGSSWIFRNIIQLIKQVELLYIKPVLGDELFDDLKEKWLDDDLSNEETALLDHLCNAIANYAYQMALTSPNLVQELKLVTASRSENFQKNKADTNEYDKAIVMHEDIAKAALTDAVKYLNKKASNSILPIWYTGPHYVNPNAPKKPFHHDNRPGGSTFSFM